MHTIILSLDGAEKAGVKREVLHSEGDPEGRRPRWKNLGWVWGSQAPEKTCQLGASPSWWTADVEEMGKEIGRGWRYGGTGKHGPMCSFLW